MIKHCDLNLAGIVNIKQYALYIYDNIKIGNM